MWKRHSAIRHRGAFCFPLDHRREKFFRTSQFAALGQKLNNFPDRILRFPTLQFQNHVFGIEQDTEPRRNH